MSSHRKTRTTTALALTRLLDVEATIAEICAVSGTPGLSYGVLHEGRVLHTGNFGHRNVEAQLPPTSDTRYAIGSLTKAFTAAAVGILVEDGKTTWDASVRDVLGDGFHFSNPTLTQQMSVLDVLSHRMGLQRSNQLWHGNDNTLLLEKSKVIPHMQYIKTVQPFKSTVHYSNWGYALAGAIIEKLSGDSWATYVEKGLLAPLHMNDSDSIKSADHDNFAKPYTVLDDHSFQLLPSLNVQAGSIMDSSQSIRSTVNDMLKWCQALVKAYSDQQKTGQGHSAGSPLKQLSAQMSGLTPFAKPFDTNSAYGMGWVRAQLPAILGAVGCNPGFVKSMPTAGRGSEETIIYHQGSLAGYTSSLFLIPHTQSAIVVLSNSISLNDCADWVGQLILEALLDVEERNDYVEHAKESADAHLAKYPAMRESFEASRSPDTKPKSLDAFLGKYYNELGDFYIEITPNQQYNGLQLAFQGLDSQIWKMEHYQHDSFLWLMSRDEAVSRARFPYSPEKLYKLDFLANEGGEIDSLLWAHDADGPPEKFYRSTGGETDLRASSQKPLAV